MLLVAAVLSAHVLPISAVTVRLMPPITYSDPADEYYGWGPMYVSHLNNAHSISV
jgi:hypothetical protein